MRSPPSQLKVRKQKKKAKGNERKPRVGNVQQESKENL